jgi:hypothetical protein
VRARCIKSLYKYSARQTCCSGSRCVLFTTALVASPEDIQYDLSQATSSASTCHEPQTGGHRTDRVRASSAPSLRDSLMARISVTPATSHIRTPAGRPITQRSAGQPTLFSILQDPPALEANMHQTELHAMADGVFSSAGSSIPADSLLPSLPANLVPFRIR